MVRCAECGCLSGLDPDTKAFVEVDNELRDGWETIREGRQIVQRTPACCKRLIDFHAKLGGKPDGSVHRVDVVRIIHEDIGPCAGFEPYQRGVSPTQILAMIDQRENHRFQDEQREKERRWQAEQAALADRRQDERDARQREWQDHQNEKDRRQRLSIAILAGAIAIISSAVTAFFAWVFR